MKRKYGKSLLCLFILISAVLLLSGCDDTSSNNIKKTDDSEKSILYKYDIENMDYSMFKTKFYEIHYTGNSYGSSVSGESYYTLNEDGTCSYTHTLKGSSSSTVQNSVECSYSIDGENFTVNMVVEKVVTDGSVPNSRDSLNVTGEFSDNFKYLKIGKLQYSSMHYNTYLEEYMTEVLIDPETKRDYTLGGTSLGNSEDSIDVSKYKIVDKTNE